jgi:hypothetical protein
MRLSWRASHGARLVAGRSGPDTSRCDRRGGVAETREGPPCLTPAERSRLFWTAHDARVRAITAAVHARWARMAQRGGG